MTINLKHPFVSAKADGTDASKIQPSNWNALHQLTAAAKRLMGRYADTDGDVQEISVGSGLDLSDAGVLSAPNVVTVETDLLTGRFDFSPSGIKAMMTKQSIMRSPLSVSVLGNSYSVAGPGAPNWFYEAIGYSNGLLRTNTASGVAGNTSAQMLARVTSIPATSDICFVLDGSNDSGSVTVRQHITNYIAICNALLAQGTLPVIVLTPPKNSTVAWVSQARIAEYRLACLLAIPVIDPFGGSFDQSTGNWASGHSPDGIHPDEIRYRDAGRAAVAQLISSSTTLASPMANVWGDIVGNNLLMDSGGGIGTGWNHASASDVASIASAVGDGFLGNWQTITATAVANGVASIMYRDLTLPVGWQITDTFLLSCGIKSTNASNTNISLFLRWVNSGGGGIRDDAFVYNTSAISGLSPRHWQQELVPPAGTVSAKLFMQMISTSAGTYTGSLSICQPMLFDLTLLAGM